MPMGLAVFEGLHVHVDVAVDVATADAPVFSPCVASSCAMGVGACSLARGVVFSRAIARAYSSAKYNVLELARYAQRHDLRARCYRFFR